MSKGSPVESIEELGDFERAHAAAHRLRRWRVDEPTIAAEMERRGPFPRDTPFLIRDRAVSVVPSARAALRMHERDQSWAGEAGLELAAFAVPDKLELPAAAAVRFQRFLPALKHAEAEIEAVRNALAVPDDRCLLSIAPEGATRDALLSIMHSRSPRVRYVHVVAHGLCYEDAPELSGLAMALDGGPDPVLRVGDIAASRLRARLVVLSSCDSARGRIVNGEGVHGLVRAFLMADAAAVCASAWSVPDDSTPVLIEALYRHLRAEEPLPNALRLAQLEMLAREDGFSGFYHWAGFAAYAA